MKKIYLLLLVLVCTLCTLVGCKKDDVDATEPEGDVESIIENEDKQEPVEDTVEEFTEVVSDYVVIHLNGLPLDEFMETAGLGHYVIHYMIDTFLKDEVVFEVELEDESNTKYIFRSVVNGEYKLCRTTYVELKNYIYDSEAETLKVKFIITKTFIEEGGGHSC